MPKQAPSGKIDDSLAARVAALSSGGQRWLKTALQAIRTIEPGERDVEDSARAGYLSAGRAEPERLPPRPANLEDVVTGKADLREQLESYPELAEELDGLADVIDLLREAGETRRKRGEQILREEILGDETAEEGEAEGEDDPT